MTHAKRVCTCAAERKKGRGNDEGREGGHVISSGPLHYHVHPQRPVVVLAIAADSMVSTVSPPSSLTLDTQFKQPSQGAGPEGTLTTLNSADKLRHCTSLD